MDASGYITLARGSYFMMNQFNIINVIIIGLSDHHMKYSEAQGEGENIRQLQLLQKVAI